MGFPLPRGHFGDVHVSAVKRYELAALVRHRLDTLLADEQRYADRQLNHEPRLDPGEWKFLRVMDELRLYRRRCNGRSLAELASTEDFNEASRAVASGQPSMVAVGRLDGSLDDLLYGLAATTPRQMQTTQAFLNAPTDCALLHVLEHATAADPMHFAALKWLLAKSPAPRVLAPRDLCYLEAMGVELDASGQRYGYLVLHSVELPECPPFERRKSNVERGRLFFTCLFRETAPGFVQLIARGVFDLAGDHPRLALPFATTAFFGGLLKAVRCAQAKKLTLLARHHAVTGHNRDPLQQLTRIAKDAVCSVCIKRGGSRVLSGVRLRLCRSCGVVVCSRCSAKKAMFLGTAAPYSFGVCCPTCALEAHRMADVRPHAPEYGVVADYFDSDSSLEDDDDLDAVSASGSPRFVDAEAESESEGEDDGDDGVWAGRDAAQDYANTVSDLESGEYRFSSGEGDAEDVKGLEYGDALGGHAGSRTMEEIQRELEAAREALAEETRQLELERMSERESSLSGATEDLSTPLSGGGSLDGDSDGERPEPQWGGRHGASSAASSRVEALMGLMIALQVRADQAHATAQSNEVMMRSLR